MMGMAVEVEPFAPLSAGVKVEDGDSDSLQICIIVYDQGLQMRMICLRCSTSKDSSATVFNFLSST
ncbi:hypothetical protein MUK42_06554 [Musa troglodytarum]|uniref:Uncharacterized protein n=1 Tax=Musa troglodytarum TaxID=320322 RepID=A0A9E7FQH3_9LILI|nr:hypothetical protein MUK42_06554 [Musa troglodytarum]